MAGDDALPLQNPVTRYPRPPFKVVDDKPEPPPDHGEDTYVGHGRLKGRKVLITGGNSGIGRATAIAMGREGADVVMIEEPGFSCGTADRVIHMWP